MLTAMCIEAANYIIEKTNEFNDKNYCSRVSMTCKRLQKMLYFSDVEHMKRYKGESMFKDEFHAWPSGPVIPSVYYEFSEYQNGKMEPIKDGDHSPLTKQMRDTIDYILSKTMSIDTLDLIKISHVEGGPWAKYYNENDPKHEQIIPKNDIYAFYEKQEVFAQPDK